MTYFFLIVFIIEALVLIQFDRKIWGTYLTPIAFISIPYIIMLVLAIFVAPLIGFYNVYWKSILVWCIGLFVFWLPGFILGAFSIKRTNKLKNVFAIDYPFIWNFKFIKQITFIIILFVYYLLFVSIKNYGVTFLELESSPFYSSLSSHLTVLLRYLLVIFIAIYKKGDKMLLFFILSILVFSIFHESKSWILIPVISGIIGRYLLGNLTLRISIKYVLYIVLAVFLVFFIGYFISTGRNLPMHEYNVFLFKQIAKYAFGGIISFSEYLRQGEATGIDPSHVFRSIVNFIHFLTGGEIKELPSNIWTPITPSGTVVNIKTFFGCVYIYSGPILGILSILLFGFIHYVLLGFVISCKSLMILAIYLLWCSMLVFGWFGIYVNNLSFIELPVFGIFFYFINKLRIEKN